MATSASSPLLRFHWSLGFALLVCGVLGGRLLAGTSENSARARSERLSLIALQALSHVVERAAGPGASATAAEGSGFASELEPPSPSAETSAGPGLGDELKAVTGGAAAASSPDLGKKAIRRAVARFAREHPEVRAVRVVTLEERELTASTAAADRGAKTAPRPLELTEKPLFDLAQRLRSAVQGNREGAEGGSVRAAEVVRQWSRDHGGETLTLAVPLERGGEVVGMVESESSPAAGAPVARPSLLWVGVALYAAFLLLFALPKKRYLPAFAAAVLLLGFLAVQGWQVRKYLALERRQTAERVTQVLFQELERAKATLAEIGAPAEPPLDPLSWGSDPYRRPLGAGAAISAATSAADDRHVFQTTLAVGLLGFAVLFYIGFGWASRTGRALVEHRQAYLYTLPALAGMLVLVFFPFFYGIALSFTNANIYNSDKPVADIWVGLDNYRDILSDVQVSKSTANGRVWDYGNFYWTLGFTVLWTVSNVSIGVTLGLLLALSLNTKGLAFRAGYRVLLILPWAVPSYISALIFRGMFHQQYGVVNQLLQIAGCAPIAWFDRPLTSFLAVLTTNGWLSFPFMMVVSLGALQSIPADLYEAARVDGAGRWQQFRSITLPSLKPALVPAVILSVIWTFNMFNIIYLVSAGQPSGATEILITQAYKLAFEQYRYGYAAAYSTVIFLILLVYGTWQNRVTRATEAVAE